MVNSFTYTTNKHLAMPAYANLGWNDDLNKNFDMIDGALGATQGVNIQGFAGGNLLLTSQWPPVSTPVTNYSYIPLRLAITGTPNASTTVLIPAGAAGMWLAINATGGGFPIYIKNNAAGAQVLLTYGLHTLIFSDGVNCVVAGQSTPTSSTFVAGDYKYSASSNGQNGWVICNGQDYLSTTFPALFNAIGQRYGTGNPANGTNFNVPNLIGRVLAHSNQGTGVAPGLEFGTPAGAATVWLDINMIPYHDHGGGNHGHGASQDGHQHTIPSYVITGGGGNVGVGAPAWGIAQNQGTSWSQPNVYIGGSGNVIGAQGGGGGHNNLQPSFGCYIFIYLGV